MAHQLYDIWFEEHPEQPIVKNLPWCAQLVDNVGHFPTEMAAQEYVDAVRKQREKLKAKLR